jgi:hypothetical protein
MTVVAYGVDHGVDAPLTGYLNTFLTISDNPMTIDDKALTSKMTMVMTDY